MLKPEAKTRKELIDPAIEKAQWRLTDRTQVGFEIPVDGADAAPWNGVTDYVLWRENGDVLAVVEAKKSTFEPRLAQQQLDHYLTEIAKHQGFRPFGFLTNGVDIHFWDADGPPRQVQGFFSRVDLEGLLFARQNRRSLAATPINLHIVNRDYQLEAVRRLCQAFEVEQRRRALLVMATGTGKTRTAMALIDLFIRANQARNVLFVADRDALVEQALETGFERFIPAEPCMRLTSGNIADTASHRLFAVTLQTLSNIFESFTPAFFDLIIFDEVHRSIFNKWDEVLDYFDGCMIGLTATPAAFIERNTFFKFDCFDGIPTFLYDYPDAVKAGHLVDFRLYRAATNFQRAGIHGTALSEAERDLLIELGYDPDEIDFEGSELEKTVTNQDTLRRQWQEIMNACYTDQSGQLPAKTIVFALTQEHAVRLAQAFEEMYPQWGKMAQVITYQSDYRRQAIENFKKEEMPRIAISVDMLETGIDVPEVMNLVFMRPIESRIKLQQMIGRGTRNQEACAHRAWLPGGGKSDFLIIDFWNNDFERPAGAAPPNTLPVLVSLFNTRLRLLEHDLTAQQSPDFARLVTSVRQMIASIPLESYSVRRVYLRPGISEAWTDEYWRALTQAKLRTLRNMVGPLLRYVARVDVAGATFTHRIERLKLGRREGKNTDTLVTEIVDDVQKLPTFVLDDGAAKNAVDFITAGNLVTATPAELDGLITTLAPHMRQKRAEVNPILRLDLGDYIASRGYIIIRRDGQPETYVADYRAQVEQRITDLVRTQPAIQAMRRGEQVSDAQLITLERTLRQELASDPVALNDEHLRQAYGGTARSLLGLVRAILDLDAQAMPDYAVLVERQFDAYIQQQQTTYNADQLRFLRAVKAVLLRHVKPVAKPGWRLDRNALYDDAAFETFGADAVAHLFTERQIADVLAFADTLTA
jgi:type I restriction enzyme, R subunit